jgi:peptidyl-prolyl cis-trans isomerase C
MLTTSRSVVLNYRGLSCVLVGLVAVAGCRKAPASSAQSAGSTSAPATAAQPQTGQAAAQPQTPGQPPAPAPVKPVPQQLPDVVARVNGEAVKKADFDRMVHTIEARAGQPIPPDRRDEILRGALDQLVVYTLLSQESKNRQIKIADAEVDKKVQELRSQFPTQEAFDKALKERGLTLDLLKHDAFVDLSVSKLMDTEMASQITATDQEAKDFYEKNPDKFKQEESVRASHILIRVDQNADAATKKKAKAEIDAVLKQARAGADFAKLAQEHSQDGSAAQGGDLNYFGRGKMVPAFDEVAFALKPGQISNVVQTQFGYHVIKVTDRKGARTVPYDEASGQIKQFLTQQRQQQHADEFIAGLKKKSKIEVLI